MPTRDDLLRELEECSTDLERLATRLRWHRECSGLTQVELSRRARVPLQTLKSWELGKKEPRAFGLASVAKVYNVGVDELLGVARGATRYLVDVEACERILGLEPGRDAESTVASMLEKPVPVSIVREVPPTAKFLPLEDAINLRSKVQKHLEQVAPLALAAWLRRHFPGGEMRGDE